MLADTRWRNPVGCWWSSCSTPGSRDGSSPSGAPGETRGVGGAGEDFRQCRTAHLGREAKYGQRPLSRRELDYIADQLPALAPDHEDVAAGGGDVDGHGSALDDASSNKALDADLQGFTGREAEAVAVTGNGQRP